MSDIISSMGKQYGGSVGVLLPLMKYVLLHDLPIKAAANAYIKTVEGLTEADLVPDMIELKNELKEKYNL